MSQQIILDIESIVWLENWLANYTGAVVLVSHDKLFRISQLIELLKLHFLRLMIIKHLILSI